MQGTNLHIDDGGTDGVPVVFVHSAAGSTEHWRGQLAHLRARGQRAIAIDLRGHGRSPPPADHDYSIPAMASDVIAAADALGLERFVVAGHSMGGAVAVSVAGLVPGRVAGLLLLDPASDGRAIPTEEADGLMAALRADPHGTVEQYWSTLIRPSPDAVRAFLVESVRRTPGETLIETLAALLVFDPVTPLERYRGPGLSIITELNETPTAYHALVPSLPHRKIDSVGHWLHLDAPDTVNRLIDDFLRSASETA